MLEPSTCDALSFIALYHQLIQSLVLGIGMSTGLMLFYGTLGTIIKKVKAYRDNQAIIHVSK